MFFMNFHAKWFWQKDLVLTQDSRVKFYLNWKNHTEEVSYKLNRSQALLIKRIDRGENLKHLNLEQEAFLKVLEYHGLIGPWVGEKKLTILDLRYTDKYITIVLALIFSLGVIYIAFFGLAPRAGDFFWNQNLLFNVATSWILGYIFLLKHEYAHWLLAKLGNLKAQISFKIRWFFLFAETDLPGIYRLPESARLQIYLAGLILDLLTMVILLWAKDFVTADWARLLGQAYLIQWMSMLWQLLFFFKTDIYLFITDLFDLEDYHDDTWDLIKKKKWSELNLISLAYILSTGIGSIIFTYRIFVLNLPITFTVFYFALSEIAFPTNSINMFSAAFVLLVETWRIIRVVVNSWHKVNIIELKIKKLAH